MPSRLPVRPILRFLVIRYPFVNVRSFVILRRFTRVLGVSLFRSPWWRSFHFRCFRVVLRVCGVVGSRAFGFLAFAGAVSNGEAFASSSSPIFFRCAAGLAHTSFDSCPLSDRFSVSFLGLFRGQAASLSSRSRRPPSVGHGNVPLFEFPVSSYLLTSLGGSGRASQYMDGGDGHSNVKWWTLSGQVVFSSLPGVSKW